jgi:hypothetical protein
MVEAGIVEAVTAGRFDELLPVFLWPRRVFGAPRDRAEALW